MRNLAVLLIAAFAFVACAGTQTSERAPASSPGAAPSGDKAATDGHSQPGAHKHGMMKPGMMGHGMMGAEMRDRCPMGVEGTTARAEEVDGGAAMIFSTTGDVGELRRRVVAMAEMHNKHQGSGCAMMKMHEKPAASPASPTDHDAHHPKN